MNVLLLQLDGKLPLISLMKIAAHHRELGHKIHFRQIGNLPAIERQLWDDYDLVYASCIFEKTRPLAERLLQIYPNAFIGGSGWDISTTLPGIGIATQEQDYSIYPNYRHSIGYSTRGCRLNCGFCIVPKSAADGKFRESQPVSDLWRGHPHPKEIVLLDNDFFAGSWRKRVEDIIQNDFKVSLCQGINVRFLNEETATALAKMKCYDDQFRTSRVYAAWDSIHDEAKVLRGLKLLIDKGIPADNLMIFMLCGYDDSEHDREHRRSKIRQLGCRPYPMVYTRTKTLVGFQRWVIGAYDKRFTWEEWKKANFRPENLPYKKETSRQLSIPVSDESNEN
jgi:hypothetical protein